MWERRPRCLRHRPASTSLTGIARGAPPPAAPAGGLAIARLFAKGGLRHAVIVLAQHPRGQAVGSVEDEHGAEDADGHADGGPCVVHDGRLGEVDQVEDDARKGEGREQHDGGHD
eukprot:scaffold81114_cov59-Phaeocystis_antarctica.AAC.3